jgi:nucleotide-binding universal stress UspA family protein
MTTKQIVAGADGSAESIQAVEWAAQEARLRGAPLRIVSAAELFPRMTPAPHAVDIETMAAGMRRNREHVLATAARAAAEMAPGIMVDVDPLEGPPATAVTHAGSGALMLVVGSQGGGAFAAMVLGSVGRYAALHASCPVVVVREGTMAMNRHVVVGVRHPGDCEAALGFAFEEAALRKADLMVVHAWQAPRSVPPPPAEYPLLPADAAQAEAATELEHLLRGWREKYPDVDTSFDIVHGHPGRVLAGLSARADLVVLGRHDVHRRGIPGPARVAHAVLSHAHGPVVTVPSD